MKTGSISVPSGVGLPIDSHSLSPVCRGAFSKFRNPSNVLHICGKATLRDYHVVNYTAFHLRGCFAGRMGCSPRGSLPVALLAGVCTLLTPTAIPAPTLFAKGLHQCSLIFCRRMSQQRWHRCQQMDLGAILWADQKCSPKWLAQLVRDGGVRELCEAQVLWGFSSSTATGAHSGCPVGNL